MLPASAREHWPFFELRGSCHAALSDQPGFGDLAQYGGTVALATTQAPVDLPVHANRLHADRGRLS